jgi:hypothetical protein
LPLEFGYADVQPAFTYTASDVVRYYVMVTEDHGTGAAIPVSRATPAQNAIGCAADLPR